uniref:glycosyltransferase family 8 protein n=1 Tax=Algoriphagus sp. TaxID=1872435 RepID=UPI00404838B1
MRSLVFSLDDNYKIPFKVFYSSLINTQSIPLGTEIFIIHDYSLTEITISELEEFVLNNEYDFKLNFINAANVINYNQLPLDSGDHVTYATYFRLFVSNILPNWVESILYLDIDMLAMKSIKDLFYVELKYPIAAVDHLSFEDQMRLGGEGGGQYFQAGVLLIDLKFWRETNMGFKLIQTLNSNKNRIKWWDQDILNIEFFNNWQRLSIYYNVSQNGVLKYYNIDSIKESVKIIHFDGSTKPWNSFDFVPCRNEWHNCYFKLMGESHSFELIYESFTKKCLKFIKPRIKGLIFGV